MTVCPLCLAQKRTPWHHEDGEFYVCDCATCGSPMAVVRAHTLAVGEGLRSKAVAKLVETANRVYGPGSAEATPVLQNVSPLQVLLAGRFLIALAERQLNEAWSREAYRQAQERAMVEEILRSKGP